MTPQKQTVYLLVKGFKTPAEEEGYFFTPEQLNEYTANVIKQALKTACENANDVWLRKSFIDKESITSTFEKIYNKLKI